MPTLPQQAGGLRTPTLSVWANNFASGSVLNSVERGNLVVFPLAPSEGVFPGNFTAHTMLLGFSGNATASEAHTATFRVGLYTLANSTQLSLLNSVSSSMGSSASNTAFSSIYDGPRQLSFHSSAWSAVPALSRAPYWVAFNHMVDGAALALSYSGFNWMTSQFSGHIGVGNTNSTASRPFPGLGVHSGTFSALPSSVAFSDLQAARNEMGVIPTIVIHGIGA